MQLKQNSSVLTAGGDEVGRVDRVVIDPQSQRVTHVVVRKGTLFTEDKVVPMEMIETADEEQVRLREDAGDLESLPDFIVEEFIPIEGEWGSSTDAWGYVPPFFWYPPLGQAHPLGYPGYPVPPYKVETERNVPDYTVSLKEGADVLSADGDKVGEVSRVILDPDTDRVTHFLISEGLLFKERKLIPLHWVGEVVENEVRLAVDSALLERVPDYQE
jgi:uncharacterized protein YrrD